MHITVKLKLCFLNFAKVQGIICPVRWNLWIKCLYNSNNNYFLHNNLYNITFTLYNILKLRTYLFGHSNERSMWFDWFNKNWKTICFISLYYFYKILKTLWLLFMDEIQLPQGYRAITGGSFMDLFYHFHYSNHSFSICFVSDQISQYILKLVVNKTGKTNEDKSETYNYTPSKLAIACVNDCKSETTWTGQITTKVHFFGYGFLRSIRPTDHRSVVWHKGRNI